MGDVDILSQVGSPTVIQRIIEDWFEFVHSVAPILHYASFMRRLADDEARNDPEFVALVISVCAATVACLRKKYSVNYENVTAERCFEVVKQKRLLENPKTFTLEWCQASYHLGTALSSERGLDDVDGFRYFNQAVCGVKYLLHFQMPNMTFMSQQLLKRLYWLLFAGNW
jgi:hypothetical protein